MSRITPVEAPYSPAVTERMARLLPASMKAPVLFRAVARNESLFNFLVDSRLLGPSGLLDRRWLDAGLREAVILRVCVAAGNDYEWQLHVGTVAARMGLNPRQIADTRSPMPDASLWSGALRAAMALADALVGTRCVGDALYLRLREHFDEAQLIELTQLIGLYNGVAMMVALVRPSPDAYAAPLPAP